MSDTHIPDINLGEEEHAWDDCGAKPLTKELVDYLKGLGIIAFRVHWEGGSDEGYYHGEILEMDTVLLDNKPSEELTKVAEQQAREIIAKWADYPGGYYNGAGDGTSYGDEYTYNLKDMTVSHDQWYHVQQHDSKGSSRISVQ